MLGGRPIARRAWSGALAAMIATMPGIAQAAEPVPPFGADPVGQAPCPEGMARSATVQAEGFEGGLPEPFVDGWSAITTSAPEGTHAARSTLSGSSSDPSDYFFLTPEVVSGTTYLGFATRGNPASGRASVTANSVTVNVPASGSWTGIVADITEAVDDDSGRLTTWFEHRYAAGLATSWDVDNVQVFGCRTAPTTRVTGSDRYAVSAAIADTYPVGAAAYVVRGDSFADALAAVPAAARAKAPIVLVRTDSVPATVAAALARLAPRRITVVGGPSSVSEAVMGELARYTTGSVTRIGGVDRYQVAATLSSSYPTGAPAVFVASGEDFPDALSAAPLAAYGAAPLLLTRRSVVPDALGRALRRLAPQRVVVLGGPATVTEEVVAQLATYAATGAERITGPDRYAVSAAAARRFPVTTSATFLATGVDFPDAIIGAAMAGARGQPLLLTSPRVLPTAVRDVLLEMHDTSGTVVGGPDSVASIVRDSYGRTLP